MWQSITVTDLFDKVANWLTLDEAAAELKLPKGKLNRLIEENSLVAIRRNGQLLIPADTIVRGEPLAALRGTIVLLMDSGFSVEESVDWLYTPSEVLGSTPLQALIEGRKAPVRRLAQLLEL